jgi:hypothetical protein
VAVCHSRIEKADNLQCSIGALLPCHSNSSIKNGS